MNNLFIQKIWESSYDSYCSSGCFQSDVQKKASHAILHCKTGSLGFNVSECSDCGHMEFHNNSCRNRNCPNCQAVLKEIWVINAGQRSLTLLTFMWFLHFLMSLIHSFTAIKSFCMVCFTDAAPKHFWNYLLIKSGSEQHPVSFRCSTHGIRSLIIMYICIALFQEEGLQRMERFENLPNTFLFARKFYEINSKESIWLTLLPSIKTVPYIFHPPAKSCVILTTGENGKISFMKWTGALISRKRSTVLGMPLNTLAAIHIRLLYPMAVSFLLQKMK